MKGNQKQQQKPIFYRQMFKLFGCFQTFLSQPLRYMIVTLFVHLTMVIYFMVTVKQSNLTQEVATIICYVLISVIMIAFSLIDPGIIPKFNIQSNLNQIPLNRQQILKSRETGIFKKIQYNMTIKTHYLSIRYCGNCGLYRPPRAIHCYTCGVCIQKLDHHCPWLGICIAKRNYRLYIFYIILMQAFTSFICFQTIVFISVRAFEDQQVQYIFNVILLNNLVGVSGSVSVFIFTLFVIHFKLCKQDLTTNELYHKKWQTPSGNPYQKALFIGNWLKIFNRKHPSKLSFQERQQSKTKIKYVPETFEDLNQNVSKNKLQSAHTQYIDAITSVYKTTKNEVDNLDAQ